MEPQSYISDTLDQLLSLAQPRPDIVTPGSLTPGILNMPRPATFAGRVIYHGQKPDPTTLLGMMPMGGAPDEEALTAAVPRLASEAGLTFATSLGNPARRLSGTLLRSVTKELGPIEQSILAQAEKGRPMSRAGFRPSITNIKTGETVVGGIGSSHADLYTQIPGYADIRQWKHGFTTSTGQAPISDEVAYLLTGPPDRLKVAAEMLKSGIPLSTIEEAIRARQGKLP